MLSKKMKQAISCLLCTGLVLGFAGCGEPAPTTDGTVAATQNATTVPATTVPSVPATTQPPATEPEITADLLVGSWYYGAYWGDCMELKSYTFHDDGTFACHDEFLLPTTQKNELFTYGTYWDWYSEPSYEGTYEVADGCLLLCYMERDEETWEDIPVYLKYSLSLADGVLSLTDAETGETEQFAPGIFPDKDAVAPEVELSPLSGSWTAMSGGGNVYSFNRFTFFSNGAFSTGSSCREYGCPIETNEWGWYVPGKSYVDEWGYFTIEGDQLVLTFCYNEYEDYEDYTITYTILALDAEYFIIDDEYGTYIDREKVNYDSVEEMAALFGLEYNPQKTDEN